MAREQGIPVIAIDHRYTWTTESLADQWIPIRPGTDVAMIFAIANVLFKQNLYDQAFVSKWVEPTGFAQWKDYILGNAAGDDGKIDRTPEWAEAICGVPAATIRAFAQLYASSKPVNLLCGGSTGRQIFGENQSRAMMYLQAFTGNLGIAGTTAGAGTSGATGSLWGTKPAANWQRAAVTYSVPTYMAAMKWAHAIYMKTLMDAGKLTKADFDSCIGNKRGNNTPNLQMLMFRNNASMTSVDATTVLKAIKSVAHVVAWTQETYRPTAMYADLLIPQIYAFFESRSTQAAGADLFRGGRSPSNFWFFMQRCVSPPGDVWPEEYFWIQVAKKLGIADKYNPLLINTTLDQWDTAYDAVMQTAYETWAASSTVKPLNPPSWSDFQKMPIWRNAPSPVPEYPFRGALDSTSPSPFTTDSKKIEFVSPILAQGPEYVATHDYYPTGGGMSYGFGNLSAMATWQHSAGDHFYSPDVKDYPILFSTPHSHYREHSFKDNNPMLRDVYRHAAWISVSDAQQRGIKDNDLVRVFSNNGEMVVPAYVTSRVVPGTGALYECSWYEPDGAPTATMPDGVDRRGNCNFICRDVDVPYTIVGYYNCKGLAEVQKF